MTPEISEKIAAFKRELTFIIVSDGCMEVLRGANEAIDHLTVALARSSERIAVVQGDLDRESKEAESYHAFWIEERSKRIAAEAAVKAERERCAKIAEPKGPRPCDCEYGACYCRNAGDAAAVASWDADMAVARAIRTPVSGSTEAGNG